MGLFTAYHASERVGRVVVLERGRIGDPMTASFGRTRSFRNDYLDATYARLAHEAFRLWGAFELQTATRALVRCGCLNIAKRSVTPDLADTYAQMSYETLTRLGLRTESFDGAALRARFAYLDADMGRLDVDAGVVDLPAVTSALMAALEARGVRVLQGVETMAVQHDGAPAARRDRRGAAGDAIARRHRRTRHQRHPGQASRLRAADPDRQGPAERGQVLRPAGRRARALHGGRHAGDRLPGHRHLLPSDRRRARRRREDRLLQPARHAPEHHGDRQHPELRGAVHARAARRRGQRRRGRRPVRLRPRRRRRLRAGPDPGLRPTRSSASGGAARATSSPPGWGGCWPSWRCRAAPSTTSRASTPPASNEGKRHR